MSALNPLLDQLAGIYKQLPLQVLLPLHCLYVNSLFDLPASKWLLSFWIVFFGAFGGGTITSYLMYEPVALFKTQDILPALAVVWFLYNYTPVGSFYARLLPVQVVAKAACNILKAQTITNVVNKALIKFPGVLAAPLVLGTLAGCGGKISSDVVMKFFGLSSSTELDSPGAALRSSIVSAIGYALITKYAALLTPLRAETLLITLLVLHGVAEDVLGKSLDVTEPLFGLLTQVTGVPFVARRKAAAATGGASRSRAASPTSPKSKQRVTSPTRKTK